MARCKNYTGVKFGKLTYIKPTNDRNKKSVVWEAICDCGKSCKSISRKQKSCGCMSTKDFVGRKYHHLTIIRKTDQKLREGLLWEAQCDCGNFIYKHASVIIGGRIKSCRDKACSYRRALMNRVAVNKIDYTGQKYHRLTFIQPTNDRSVHGRVKWKAVCDCGNTINVIPHNGKSCGCLGEETRVAGGMKNRKFTPMISNARAVWQRGYRDCDCDFDTFYTLSQQPCDYCGRQPYRAVNAQPPKGKAKDEADYFVYNGLDRVDSNKGHTIDNIVPCCADCNWMKSNRTREEFLLHIGRIHTHSNLS